jgi:hypothetical protein
MHFDDYHKVFLPRYRDECAARCKDAYTLHLWNNRIVKMGLYKRIGPPVGSFLHEVFERLGLNTGFSDVYPASVMEAMVDNAVHKVGRDEGMSKVLRLLVPSFKAALTRRIRGVVPGSARKRARAS